MVVPPGTEADLLAPMGVRVIPGIGPATAERLRRAGATTVAQVRDLSDRELVLLLGQAHGSLIARLARAQDDREVTPDRPAKSVSVEDTYDADVTDPAVLAQRIADLAERVCGRLAATGLSGRTVTIKVRLYDFTTTNRSTTLAGPTDDARVVAPCAVRLLRELDCSAGVRLLGVGVSGLSDWVQDELFTDDELPGEDDSPPEPAGDTGEGAPVSEHPEAAVDPPVVEETVDGARTGRPHVRRPLSRPRGSGLAPGRGRRARQPWPRLGVGVRSRQGDRPVRDGRDRPRSGAHVRERRRGPAPLRTLGAGLNRAAPTRTLALG